MEKRQKHFQNAEKKLTKEIKLKQEGDHKVFDANRKKEYKANKERWKRELSMDDTTPKRTRDQTLQYQKDNLKKAEAHEEQKLLRNQQHYLKVETRKFKRKNQLLFHDFQKQLVLEVCEISNFA